LIERWFEGLTSSVPGWTSLGLKDQ